MKPELLMPAGNIESFYAALEGGADAIYIGIQDFNARQRAKNFTLQQVPALLLLAKNKNVKLFIALNIVLKNKELPAIYLILYQLQQMGVGAVIIQDLGILYLVKKHFPKLKIHASTQMAIHNSLGANFAAKAGISRIVLARELTLPELTEIRKKTKAELEIFTHGALCYSFSGLCLFSSYLGGMSANRGACKQPCRRIYSVEEEQKYLFSLKDNELIDFIPQFSSLGINSLKVEGRLKTADYVYTIASAYRMVLDNPSQLKQAKQFLKRDVGREKTSYFIGGKNTDAITQTPNTGLFTGYVIEKSEKSFTFTSYINPAEIDKIRVCSPDGQKQNSIKLADFTIDGDKIEMVTEELKPEINDMVYVAGFADKKFSSKLPNVQQKEVSRPSYKEIKSKVNNLVKFKIPYHPQLYVRIDSLAWIKSVDCNSLDFLILSLPFKELGQFSPQSSKELRANISKLIVELPKFISEENCDSYRKITHQLQKLGIDKFMVSHISQISILPSKSEWYSNENVYVFNDAAAAQLEFVGIKKHVFPLENDFNNLLTGSNRSGIMPIYFYPQLFYSRMPVKTETHQNIISDDNNAKYKILKRDGLTITIPSEPTSLLHEKHRLSQKGFKNFLIDLSFVQPVAKEFNTLISAYRTAEKLKNTSGFNFKKELS